MILKDHINLPGLAGQHPLKGPNDHRFGGRFFALNDSYDKSFRTYAKDVARELNLQDRVHEGVYAMLGGPNFGKSLNMPQPAFKKVSGDKNIDKHFSFIQTS